MSIAASAPCQPKLIREGESVMLEQGSTRIFGCSRCRVDTPHTIKATRADMCAVVCSNCRTARLVSGSELHSYQDLWQAELMHLFDELSLSGAVHPSEE